ncbi:F-box/LRR-repeat protein At1g55660-like isoform X2 [Chenopodium quinoa]|uniref:F-box/LRR-repeat protein At1g55660-like isoform X2 n=1 Tax=Chenopodium quinoa TaxID=63459 RepID=UPI000B799BE2|nr:F-box/LRR-repeat protein At1g55660-like isoform X2 [Chenopodium quinoa]
MSKIVLNLPNFLFKLEDLEQPSNTRDPPLKQLPRVCCEALLVLFAAVSINHNVRKDMACSSILQAPGMVSFLCHQWRILAENNIRCYDEANDSVVRDRLSQLSDDLLMLIMSSLTMKEVTKTSALSHRWKNLCRFLPVLLFEAHSPILKWVMGECKLKSTYNMNLKDHEWFILRHRPGFTRWVNYALEAHLAPTIDELRVVFDLDRKFATMNLISISV